MISSERSDERLGVRIASGKIDANILIPKYYRPTLSDAVERLANSSQTTTLRQLVADGHVEIATGHEIGKAAYGTGDVPFVRTSDIANWEIKADPKQSVAHDLFREYSDKQDLREGDILLVRDGTYLVGSLAIVTTDDLPMLYQSHIARLRVTERAPISPFYLLAALQSPIVQAQFRARQFTADIVDSLGDRFLDVVLPIVDQIGERERIAAEAREVIAERSKLRDELNAVASYPYIGATGPEELEGHALRLGYRVERADVQGTVLIPKYYDPTVEQAIEALSEQHEFVPLGDLVDTGLVEWATGCEVGKMAYGTGSVPFIRTSDFVNWELKRDPKHAVSMAIYEDARADADAAALDVLVVRDGTYLIGSSAMIMEADLPLLFAGGLYRLRSTDHGKLDPFFLLAAMQTDIVRRQIRSRQFTRDIIDTVGKRIFDVRLPIPRTETARSEVGARTRTAVEGRARLRSAISDLAAAVYAWE